MHFAKFVLKQNDKNAINTKQNRGYCPMYTLFLDLKML